MSTCLLLHYIEMRILAFGPVMPHATGRQSAKLFAAVKGGGRHIPRRDGDALHSEDAKLRFRDGGIVGGGEAQSYRHARVDRVEDAVVPQPRGAEVGAALALVGRQRR